MVDSQVSLLVTGGCGFAGSAFIRHLLTQTSFQGHVVNLDLLTATGSASRLHAIESDWRYHFVQGNIVNRPLLDTLWEQYRFTTIVHFAAEIHGASARSFVNTNLLGTWTLLELTRAHPEIHFHLVSSGQVYGKTTGIVKEGASYNPNSLYGASKAVASHLAHSYHQAYSLFTTVSHASALFGPYQFPDKQMPALILQCLNKKKITIPSKQSQQWLYADDHARAIYQILKKGRAGESYHIASKNPWNALDLAYAVIDEISNVLGKDSQEFIDLILEVPGEDTHTLLDTSKLETHLGFHPDDCQEGIYQTVQWYFHERAWVKRILSASYLDWIRTSRPSHVLQS